MVSLEGAKEGRTLAQEGWEGSPKRDALRPFGNASKRSGCVGDGVECRLYASGQGRGS